MSFFSRVLLMWPLIWQVVLDTCRPILFPFQRLMHALTAIRGRPYHCKNFDEEAHNESSHTNSQHRVITTKHRPIIQQSDNQKLIMIGIFSEVYLVDGTIIRKAPRSGSEEDLQPIIREATIYNLLNDHPRIAQCTSRGRMDYIDIKYYPHGDLSRIKPDLSRSISLTLPIDNHNGSRMTVDEPTFCPWNAKGNRGHFIWRRRHHSAS